MEITTQYAELSVNDGTRMRCYVARPAQEGHHPGLIVNQEAFGVNAHIRDVTERFARQGYLAIAPELYHRTAAPGFEGRYDDFPGVTPHFRAMTDEGLESDVTAAHDWLRANGVPSPAPIATIGFCLGGRVSFLAATVLQLACAISFYGGGIAPGPQGPGLLDRAARVHSPLLLFWGGRDKHLGPEQVRAVTDALRAAEKDFVNVEFSDADHAFFCDARSNFHAIAAAEAWALSLAFLHTHTSAGASHGTAPGTA
jgi:carboxymethylenebutenolidase